jgi:hypothetical protein
MKRDSEFIITLASTPPTHVSMDKMCFADKKIPEVHAPLWHHAFQWTKHASQMKRDPEFMHLFGIKPSPDPAVPEVHDVGSDAIDNMQGNGTEHQPGQQSQPPLQQPQEQQQQQQEQHEQQELQQHEQQKPQQAHQGEVQQRNGQQGMQLVGQQQQQQQQQEGTAHQLHEQHEQQQQQQQQQQQVQDTDAGPPQPPDHNQPPTLDPSAVVNQAAPPTPVSSAPTSEQLTKRYRRLLDCVGKAQRYGERFYRSSCWVKIHVSLAAARSALPRCRNIDGESCHS